MDSFIRLIEQFVNLIAAAFWPATVLFALYHLKRPIENILESFAERIRDPRSDVAVGKEGLEIKSRLQSLEIDQEQTKSLTLQALGVPETTSEAEPKNATEIDPELQAAADEYMAIEHPSWSTRVRLKDSAARKLADIVITKNISRELLARQHHEGLILALAAASHALPRSGDLEHLLHVADEANRLHVKYRIVMALGRLFERGFAGQDSVENVCALLSSYKHDADKSLAERIAYTESVVKKYAEIND